MRVLESGVSPNILSIPTILTMFNVIRTYTFTTSIVGGKRVIHYKFATRKPMITEGAVTVTRSRLVDWILPTWRDSITLYNYTDKTQHDEIIVDYKNGGVQWNTQTSVPQQQLA